MLEYVDTHCHLHFSQYQSNAEEVIKNAIAAGVSKIITVGTNAKDSQLAVDFAEKHQNVWASIGLHPHDAKNLRSDKKLLVSLLKSHKIVAIGECGLDYYYNHSAKTDQLRALRFQIELAIEYDLPLIFHIREAYDDFWPLLDKYRGVRGVAHCFSAGLVELDQILARGLYVGLNGIVTFSKKTDQIAAFKAVPADKLLLETDAPFLTPTPLRGTINEAKNVVLVAEHLSKLRGGGLNQLVLASTHNACSLFGI